MELRRKYSRKRDAILEAIRSTTTHPTAQWVYEQVKPQIPDLSLATVYRNLVQFQQDGVVAPVGVIGNEQRYDGDTKPHPHFVCDTCMRVFDLPGMPAQMEAAQEGGHQIDYQKSTFRGICNDCLRCEQHNGSLANGTSQRLK